MSFSASEFYHLDAPDCFKLLETIAEVCSGAAIIDTHVSFRRDEAVTYKGHRYAGWRYREYLREPTPGEMEDRKWASIGNLRSFWPTKPSLINAIADAGINQFTSASIRHGMISPLTE